MNIIYKGADLEAVQIALTDEMGTATDLSGFTGMELALTDNFGNIKAQYIMPFSDQTGYHALRNPSAGVLEFDIHKEDSAGFKTGTLYANVSFSSTDSAYPDGYQPEIRKIIIGEVMP